MSGVQHHVTPAKILRRMNRMVQHHGTINSSYKQFVLISLSNHVINLVTEKYNNTQIHMSYIRKAFLVSRPTEPDMPKCGMSGMASM
jgi:hypothetical protein